MSKNIASLLFVMLLAILLSNQNLMNSLDSNSKLVVSNVLEELHKDFFISDDSYELIGENYRAVIYEIEPVYKEEYLSIDSLLYSDVDGFKNVDIFLEGYEELLDVVTLDASNLLSIPYADYYVNIYDPDNIVRTSYKASADLNLIPGMVYQIYVKQNEKYAVKIISAKDPVKNSLFNITDYQMNTMIEGYTIYDCVDGIYSYLLEVDGLVGNLDRGVQDAVTGEILLENDKFEIIGDAVLKEMYKREIIGYNYSMRLSIVDGKTVIYNNNTRNYRSISSIN